MLYNIIFLISNIFQMYAIYLMFHCFYDECRVSLRWEILTYIALFFLTSIPYLVFDTAVITMLCSLSGCLLVSMLYKGSWRKVLLSGIFVFFFMSIVESIVAVFSGYVNLDMLESSNNYSIFGTVCLPIVEYLFARIAGNFKHVKNGGDVSVSYWIISIALPVFSVYLYLLFYRQQSWSKAELVGCVSVLFLINVFVFYLYDRQIENARVRQEKEMLEEQNRNQMQQIKLMHDMGEQARQQRHDFLKHVSMISNMNENGDKQRLTAYLAEIKKNVGDGQKYIETGNYVIDTILNYKIQEAASEGIQVTANVDVPKERELSAFDMTTLLMNLLDNSIEAVRELDNKVIYVDLSYRSEKLYIQVKNPYEKIMPDGTGGFISHKDGEEHGYGLKNVREVVDKYKGKMVVNTKEQVFIVKICLFLE